MKDNDKTNPITPKTLQSLGIKSTGKIKKVKCGLNFRHE